MAWNEAAARLETFAAHRPRGSSVPSQRQVGVSMTAADRSRTLLRRLAWVLVVLVLAITSLSAYIRLTRAGLSCADWPQCYGASLRSAPAGAEAPAADLEIAAARLAHRIVASSALLLVVAIVVICHASPGARRKLRDEGRIAIALLALALGLAVLGRWSSDARIPAVAIGNLLGGFAMFALCWRLARDPGIGLAPGWRAWAWIATLWVACEVALGGLVSASFAATSCTGFADCLGAARALPWTALDPWREPLLAGAPPVNASGALAQALHRFAGVLSILVVAPLAVAAWGAGRRQAATLLVLLLAGGVALGVQMAYDGPTLAFALAHNLAAALLAATLFDLARAPAPPR